MPKLATWIRPKDTKWFGPFFVPHPELTIANAYDGEVTLDDADGLLLTGGADISLEFLRQPVPDPSVLEKDSDPARDGWEFAAVSKALELSLAAGYVQGVGDIAAGRASLQDVSGAGGSAELQVGYRLTPSLALGAYGSYARYSDGNAFARPVEARGVTAGVFADFHFRADRSIDPWLGIGSGLHCLMLGAEW